MLLQLKLILFIDTLLAAGIVIFYLSVAQQWRSSLTPLRIAVVLLVPVVGLLAHDYYLFYAFVALLPLLAFGDATRLACLYVLLLPQFPELRAHFVIGSTYLCDFSAIYAFNFGALVALAFTRGAPLRDMRSTDLAAWLLFLVALGFSARGLPATAVLRVTVQTFLNVIPPYYVLSRTLRTREAAIEAMLLFVLAALCNAVVALFEMRRSWPLYQQMLYQLGVPPTLSATLSIRAGFLRAQGAIANPTALGLLLGFAIIACLALREQMTKVGRWVVLTLLAIGLIAAQSRGGWLAAGLGICLYFLYTRRTLWAVGFVSVALAGWILVLTALPKSGMLGELAGRSGDGQMTATYRSTLFDRGLEEVAAHPLVGQTLDQLQVSMNDMRQGEHIIDYVNTHLFVALTLGVFGFAVWLAMWAIPSIVAWRARPNHASLQLQPQIAFPFAMLGAAFLGLAFTSTIDRTLPWAAMSFGLIGAFVAINQRRVVQATVARQPVPLLETSFPRQLPVR